MSNTISNSDNVIDSRDVIERIAELESLRDDAQSAAESLIEENESKSPEDRDDDPVKETMEDGAEIYTSVDFGEEEYNELKTLKALEEEASGCADWAHGETLIRDSYFEEYAQEFAEDIGAVQKGMSWPYTCIDWEQAASELQQDYTS